VPEVHPFDNLRRYVVTTSYEVTIRLHPEGSATAVRDVLEQSLRDTEPFLKAPVIEPSADDRPDLLVVSTVDADDASSAQVAVRDALTQAIRHAGLLPESVRLDDPQVRSSA
jgi:hypothetical protein